MDLETSTPTEAVHARSLRNGMMKLNQASAAKLPNLKTTCSRLLEPAVTSHRAGLLDICGHPRVEKLNRKCPHAALGIEARHINQDVRPQQLDAERNLERAGCVEEAYRVGVLEGKVQRLTNMPCKALDRASSGLENTCR